MEEPFDSLVSESVPNSDSSSDFNFPSGSSLNRVFIMNFYRRINCWYWSNDRYSLSQNETLNFYRGERGVCDRFNNLGHVRLIRDI